MHKHKDHRVRKRVTFAEAFAAIKKKGAEFEGKKNYSILSKGKSDSSVPKEEEEKKTKSKSKER